jgi:hypothetical protein
MSRLIKTDSPSTERQRLRRSIAEALHRLAGKTELDDEAKDLVSLIVLALREIVRNIESSAAAWEKRYYFEKAEALRTEWAWAGRYADRAGKLVKAGDWVRMPLLLADLSPRFKEVRVTKLTRTSKLWEGAYDRLMQE